MSLRNSFYAQGFTQTGKKSKTAAPNGGTPYAPTHGGTFTPGAPPATPGANPFTARGTGTGRRYGMIPERTPGQISTPAPQPADPILTQQVGAAARRRDDTIAGLGAGRGRALDSYGYSPTYNADGSVANLTFDPRNPFSQAALLKRNYDNARAGNVTSLAARGQLYAGSLQNAQAATNFGQGAAEDQLKKRLIEFIAKNQGGITAASTDYDLAVPGFAADSLARTTGSKP